MLYPLINRKSTLYTRFKLLLYKMCVRPALLYGGGCLLGLIAASTKQILKNNFKRSIWYANGRFAYRGRNRINRWIYVMNVSIAYNHDHLNPLIRDGNYKIYDLPFKIHCLPKHFMPINTHKWISFVSYIFKSCITRFSLQDDILEMPSKTY